MVSYRKHSILAVFFLFLAACAITPKPAEVVLGKQQRIAVLTGLTDWQTNGVVSVTYQKKTEIVSLNWQQSGNNYHLSLFGPLGLGQVEINGMPDKVTLRQGNRPILTAASAEQLLADNFGWSLPIRYLQAWARGIAVKGLPARASFDGAGRLQYLEQAGWQIDYISYRPLGQLALPYQIQLSYRGLIVKLVLRQWQLPDSGHYH